MDIQVVDFESKSAPETFTKSLKDTGFAVLVNHPIEDGLIQEVYDEWREFLKYMGEEMEMKNNGSSMNGGNGDGNQNGDGNNGDGNDAQYELSPAASQGSTAAVDTSFITDGATSGDSSPETRDNEVSSGAQVLQLRGTSGDATDGNDDKIKKPSGIEEPMFNKSTFKAKNNKMKSATMTSSTDLLCDRYHFDPATQDGYFPMKISEKAKGASVKDLKHYYHFYMNGRYPKEVSERARILGEKMRKLGRELVKWIDEYMSQEIRSKLPENMQPQNGGLSEWVCDEQTLLRILHYPAYKSGSEEPGAVRAAAHEDINCITVLPAGSSKGLQVRSKQTGEWYDVPCIRGSLIINIGDMLQEATRGEYISTTHRVVKPFGDEFEAVDRMATPCFIHFKPPTYLSDKYPTAEQFLHERLRELGVL